MPSPATPGCHLASQQHDQPALPREWTPAYPVIRPHGGWSLLIDADPLGLTPAALSKLLFDRAKVATTPMNGWGPSGDRYLRIVFANEPVGRLTQLGERFRLAVG